MLRMRLITLRLVALILLAVSLGACQDDRRTLPDVAAEPGDVTDGDVVDSEDTSEQPEDTAGDTADGAIDGATDDVTDGGADTGKDVANDSGGDAADATDDTRAEDTGEDVTDRDADLPPIFQCGDRSCQRGSEYCRESHPGVRPADGGLPDPSYECRPYGDCGQTPDCSCLKKDNAVGGAGAQCREKSPGAYHVEVFLP